MAKRKKGGLAAHLAGYKKAKKASKRTKRVAKRHKKM